MSMIWRKLGLINPALVGLALLLPTTAIAAESLELTEEVVPEISAVEQLDTEAVEASEPLVLADADVPTTSVSELMSETQDDNLAQVTSVSQLSDVQPDDWAFQAIQSLVERYGCVAGYPNGTFRPSRAMSRREAAALVNACLDNLSNRFATKEDLDALKALQDEFAAELATLRGRVDGLEARVATVEAQQFSTTAKLNGEVVFGSAFVFDGDNDPLDSILGVDTDTGNTQNNGVVVEDRFFLGYRTRLNFDASFSGTDRLRVRLEAADIPELDEFGSAGTSLARFGFDENDPAGNTVILDELNYRFKPAEDLTLKIAIVGGDYKDDVETFNPFLKSSGSGALSRFFRFNPLTQRGPGGTTLSAVYDVSEKVNLSVVYAADDAQFATTAGNGANNGLFDFENGTYGVFAQIGFNPTDDIGIGVQYSRNEYTAGNVDITSDTGDAPVLTGGLALGGDTSDPFNGLETITDNFGLSFNARVVDGFHVSGWGGLTLARTPDIANSQIKLLTWAANLVFPDLLLEGGRGSLSFGQQPYIIDGGNLNIDDGTSSNFTAEAQYQFKVNDNIKISPGLIVIFNANNTSSNDPIFIPVIRTTFKF
ncbi:iron uptake porin [Acaryochloris marina]|uniref:Carbohydrate-selective porin OprB family n=1 Tax=Acaryochloris marina (strain MBIC 11017) TaxID=329726 RepID=B0C516_ACAM1|nr:iron uptake porin [Acaryochloris marina]ABW25128.1 carbohydrate-selective porin OprB family [Acaryochloris marina MBIC11017]BDM80108.1 porin [Acaryochloris marina MBIC10699]